MTIVLIENILGSGQIIQVLEDFGHHVVTHKLQPGDNRRIAVSRFKSIVVNEATAEAHPVALRASKSRVAVLARA